jgi:hypothetical protein
MYGELQAFQLEGLVAATLCTITSVPARLGNPTPVQVVQLFVDVVPATSNDAVEPGGGINSTKFNPN